MKKKSLFLVLLSIFLLCLSACGQKESQTGKGMKIVTSFYPIYAMVKEWCRLKGIKKTAACGLPFVRGVKPCFQAAARTLSKRCLPGQVLRFLPEPERAARYLPPRPHSRAGCGCNLWAGWVVCLP